MSQGDPLPRADALRVAEALVASLAPVCERVEIAGSLRRGKPEVRDIELVASPRWFSRPGDDIWSTPAEVDLLEERLREMLSRRAIEARAVANHRADGTIDYQTKLGPAFKALVAGGVATDLFIVRPPATWGVIFGLRTGPGDWNTKLVTDCKVIGRRVEGGQVLAWRGASQSWEPVPTPTERDFFTAIGQEWVEPTERHVDRVRIQRNVAAAVPA